MKNQKFCLIIILALFIVVACKKEDVEMVPWPLPDAVYPATYKVLPQSTWEALDNGFQHISKHGNLGLNAYGFLEGSINFKKADERIDADLVLKQVGNVLEKYSEFLGMNDISEVELSTDLIGYDYSIGHGIYTDVYNYFEGVSAYENLMSDYYGNDDLVTEHHFFLHQKQIENKEIKEAWIEFIFDESKSTMEVKGNWFPMVVVPAEEIVPESEGVRLAFGFAKDDVLQQGDGYWSGYVRNEIYEVGKKFVPVSKASGIEIHDCWFLYIPIFTSQEDQEVGLHFYHYEIYIDTQTGEIEKSSIVADYPY